MKTFPRAALVPPILSRVSVTSVRMRGAAWKAECIPCVDPSGALVMQE